MALGVGVSSQCAQTGKARIPAPFSRLAGKGIGSGQSGSAASLERGESRFTLEGLMHRIRRILPEHGRSIPQETWDRQYREGAWEGLDSLDEFAHYMVIAGYIHHLFESPKILDVGSGQGHLVELLALFSFKSHLGIDLSAEAIRRAQLREQKHTSFHVADLNEWNPTRGFSVIIFCESLNYAMRPVSTLLRYAHALERNGAFIVSLYRHRNHRRT